MIAYDKRRSLDPSQRLLPATLERFRAALRIQARAGQDPVPELAEAIRKIAAESKARGIRPEFLLQQLNELLMEAATEHTRDGPSPNRGIERWLVTACLRAYLSEPR